MKLELVDRISFDDAGIRITKDGYLVANPRVARTGIQLYRGSEVGMKDKAIVRVYRPEDEVFNKDAMASLAHRPLTNDHPPVPVTADNWKDYAIGQSGDEVARDGDCLRVPMSFMDANAIKDIQAGKKQLSVGYSCDIVFQDGKTPSGEQYDAIQTQIRGNHIALVKFARGGYRLAVGDKAPLTMLDGNSFAAAVKLISDGKFEKTGKPEKENSYIAPGYPIGDGEKVYVSLLEQSGKEAFDSGDEAVAYAIDSLLKLVSDFKTEERTTPMPKTIIVDGVSVEFTTDQNAQIVQRALDAAAQALKDAKALADTLKADHAKKEAEDAATITTLTTARDGLTAEVATLKKAVEDAKLTPAKLDALVADRAVVSGKARAILGDALVVDGKTDAEIKRQVVDKKLGEAAKGWTDEQVSISFATLTADVKATDSSAVLDARRSFAAPGFVQGDSIVDKRDAALEKRDSALTEAWKTAGAVATH